LKTFWLADAKFENDHGPQDVLLSSPTGLSVILTFAVRILATAMMPAIDRETTSSTKVPSVSEADSRQESQARNVSQAKLIGLPEFRNITMFACQMPFCFLLTLTRFAFS